MDRRRRRLDADGFLTLKDRSKDLIISGGSNIYPREVEEVLLTAPGVAEVAVVGAPDAEWGEVVVAFVVAQAGADARRRRRWTRIAWQRIARFKRPKRYRWSSTRCRRTTTARCSRLPCGSSSQTPRWPFVRTPEFDPRGTL